MSETTNSILLENTLKESTSAQVGKFEPLITPLLQKIYRESLVSQIADVQPILSPVGKISALFSLYTGDKSDFENKVYFETSKIIAIDSAFEATFLTDGTVYTTSSGGTFSVIYKENVEWVDKVLAAGVLTSTPITLTLMVIINITGTVALSDTVSGATILSETKNFTAIKKVLQNYSGPYTIDLTNINGIDFQVRSIPIECKTRKILTNFTWERVRDLFKIHGEKAYDIVSKNIKTVIEHDIDIEVINYLKNIAKPMPDVNLHISLGMQSGLLDISNDIVSAIFFAVESIVRATKRNRTMFILCDSSTASFLQVNPWNLKAKYEESNPYYIGNIASYPIFCDMYSHENYILVGYKYFSDEVGDAGLIFAPYINTLVGAIDPDTFHEKIMTINRYAFTRHPQDSGTGIGDSDFFRMIKINYDGVEMANLSPQIANFI